MRLDGSPPRSVTPESFGYVISEDAAWHPDGKRLSFWGYRRRDQMFGFWTAPLLPGAEPILSEFTPEMARWLEESGVWKFAWAPSGQAVYFEGSSRAVSSLWKATLDPKTLRWIAGPERLTTGPGPDTNPALSMDGKRLPFCTRSGTTRVWLLRFDAATGRVNGPGEPLTPPGVPASQPNLTADGSKLSYQVGRGEKSELWVKYLDGGRETLLAADEFDRDFPRWSPDGTGLAYRRAKWSGQRIVNSQVVLLT